MTAERIQELFKTLGKLVFIDQLGRGQAADLKAAIVALQQQHAAAVGTSDQYAALQLFVSPAVANSRPIVQALDRLALVARGAAENFIRSLAGELGQSSALSATSLLSALRQEMVDESQSVLADGLFHTYCMSKWGIALPTAAVTPTIADTLVTVELQ